MIAKRFAAGARLHGAAAPDCSIMRAHMSAVVNAAAVDKRKILVGNPIKSLGDHEVTVKVHDELEAKVLLHVVPA